MQTSTWCANSSGSPSTFVQLCIPGAQAVFTPLQKQSSLSPGLRRLWLQLQYIATRWVLEPNSVTLQRVK